jgi:integrase
MMARLGLRYVKSDVDRHGNARYYFRKRGMSTKIRLPGLPGSTEFMQVYQACLSGAHPTVEAAATPAPAPDRTSFRWLCTQYFGSAEFKQLEPTTQRRRRSILETICKEPASDADQRTVGSLPFAGMPPRAVRRLRDRKAELPEAANSWLKAMKAMFQWAVEVDLLETNPAKDVPRIKNVSDGFHTWTVDEVRKFEDRHPIGSNPRLALALLLYTGQRRSDVVLFGRQHVKDGWLKFTQFKNRNRKPVTLELPILPELQAIIDATPSNHLTFLATAYGRPFSAAGFGNRFREWCDQAELPHCTAHGLRKAGACMAAENGASESQLMAIFGWQTMQQAAHYTKAANQRRIAGSSMHLLRKQTDKA